MSLNELISAALLRNENLKIDPYIKILNPESELNSKFKPICKRTVAYIVAIVLINDKNQICLIQEAKESCRGKWYFPAGRMEQNEDLFVAAKRECEEETGYKIEPLCLCSIEIDHMGYWYRFTFIATITGGSLKTTKQADAESLQAAWFELDWLKSKEASWSLRAQDFLKLANVCCEYYKKYNFNSLANSPQEIANIRSKQPILPSISSFNCITFTYLILHHTSTTFSYLIYEENSKQLLPSCVVSPEEAEEQHCIEHLLEKIVLAKAFQNSKYIESNFHGAIGISHDGKFAQNIAKSLDDIHDGLHLVFLFSIKNDVNNTSLIIQLKEPFKWIEIASNNDQITTIKENLNDKLNFIQIMHI